MRFVIENSFTYSLLIECAEDTLNHMKPSDRRFHVYQKVLIALKSDRANMYNAIGKTANRTSPLVENANIYLTAKELIDFARSQEDMETVRFCQVTIFGAIRLINSRLAQELGRENLLPDEEAVVYDILDDAQEMINDEANEAYQLAQF